MPSQSAKPTAAAARPSLWADAWAELKWTWIGRKGWLVGIGINLAIGLIYVSVTYYDPAKADDIRTINGIAAGLVLWVLSDPVNTNQLGPEADRAIGLLHSGFGVARMLFVKNVALITLLLPLAMALSGSLRYLYHEDRAIPSALLLDVWIVLGWLALGNLASVLAPYRPMPLKERWLLRSTWLWWVFCQALPYGLYFLRAYSVEPAVFHISNSLAKPDRANADLELSLAFALSGLLFLLISYGICGLYGRWWPHRLELTLLKHR